MSRASAIERAERLFDDGSFLEALARRIAIHTESQIPESRPHLLAYLKDEIGPALEKLGYRCEIMANPVTMGGPFLVAERIEDAGLPTALTYGHGDVVRGLDAQWESGLSPWVLERRGNRVYGRGVADNKGQHAINIASLACVLVERGKLGFNSKILIETSEEIGSPGLPEFCAAEKARLSADLLIASDGPRLQPERATIFMGSRGVMNFDLVVNSRKGGHHSGNWGGLISNPGIILANALASIVDARGKVKVRELVPASIPNSVRNSLAGLEVGGGEDAPKIEPDWGEPGLTPAERVFAWNAFEVLAFKTGNPENPVNAIPPRAVATCQIRYTVDRDPASFLPALRRHLDANGFQMVEVKPWDRGFMNATRLDPDHPWAQWAIASVARTMGNAPAVLPNLGGSLPNDCFSDILGMPTIWVPHSYAGCSQHAPNEHGLATILREGLRIMTGLFWDLGEKGRVPEVLQRA